MLNDAQFPLARARFIAASATMPNVQDIAEWLHVDMATGLHVFGEDYRPVRLITLVRGYNVSKVGALSMRAGFYTTPIMGLNAQCAGLNMQL